ncbi:MAG TPA: hypothetical protein VHX61_09830 [Rhizomicrobium sp.]|nr:hypothetical protein [Rhizomicrobium sp.]
MAAERTHTRERLYRLNAYHCEVPLDTPLQSSPISRLARGEVRVC